MFLMELVTLMFLLQTAMTLVFMIVFCWVI